MILMNRLCVPDVLLANYLFLNLHLRFLILKFTAGKAIIYALRKSLVLGRGRFASLGCTTDRGTDLKLQWQSWRYDKPP